MAEDTIELALSQEEVDKLKEQTKAVADNSKKAAQTAYAFAEYLATMVNAVNAANAAQAEYLRLVQRAAKARARQPGDVADLDIKNGKILFKKTKRDLLRVVQPEETDDGPDAIPEG